MNIIINYLIDYYFVIKTIIFYLSYDVIFLIGLNLSKY